MIDAETERLLSYYPDLTDSTNCSHLQSAKPGKPTRIRLRDTTENPAPTKWGSLTRSKDGKNYKYAVEKLNGELASLGEGNWTEFLELVKEAKARIPQRKV